ncbi:hypothetical protein HHI36_017692 [Cryptolaemus montrouzieri]|uniref:Uncharacterized protein n=1 Tax=Cryptolaemus montrouzieri TaxID=559131 RepID=A0ABD2NNB4_9CUCU
MKKDNINIATTSRYFEPLKTEENLQLNSNSVLRSTDDFIASSQPENEYPMPLKKAKEKSSFNVKKFEENHNDVLAFFSKMDGAVLNKNEAEEGRDTLLSACEKLEKTKEVKQETVLDIDDNSMDVDNSIKETSPKTQKTKSRITDYFTKLGKS